MNTSIENYFVNGCMRCPKGGTPECKVNDWKDELQMLRGILNKSELTEEVKWGNPCYTYNTKNILMLTALNNFVSLSFFKGVLLKDSKNLLQKPGPHSQSARLFKFTSTSEIQKLENDILSYINEAIQNEKLGKDVEFKKNPEPLPEELKEKMEEDQVFKSAFESLTPGRQRGYILHFSKPKQGATRISRIEKCTAMILNGIGLHDKYKRTNS